MSPRQLARVGAKFSSSIVIIGLLIGQRSAIFDNSESPSARGVTRAAISEASAAPIGSVCPGQTFSTFIDAFSESSAIQRQYTQIPLAYGQLDQTLLGTSREDEAFSTKNISSFEAIPSFNKKDNGRIFPSKSNRLKYRLELNVMSGNEHSRNEMIAAFVIPDTGFYVEYRFVKHRSCWKLVEINDRST